jgi:tRNA (guanosine-2'-O-)-methyltransferase
MASEERIKKLRSVLKNRQIDLKVILEDINDPHNVNAIYRTCEAVGVMDIILLYIKEEFPEFKFNSSGSACKWIDLYKFSNPKDIISKLKKDGYQVYSLVIDENAKTIYDVDWNKPSVIIVGNEHSGVSNESQKLSTSNIYIPMMGVVESLNVSVATAVTLYEASRQRKISGKYPNNNIDSNWLEEKLNKWIINRDEY